MNSSGRKQNTVKTLEIILEIILLALAYYIIFKIFSEVMDVSGYAYRGKYVIIGIYVVLIILIFKVCDSFNIGNLKVVDLAVSQSISLLLVNVITYFQLCLIANHMIVPWPMLILTLVDILLVVIWSYIATSVYNHYYVKQDVILIYGTDNALDIVGKFNSRADKYHVSEMVSSDTDEEEIIRRIRKHDSVVLNDIPVEKRNILLKYCYTNGIRTYMVPRITDILIQGADKLNIFDTPVSLVRSTQLTLVESAIKRLMDIIIALVAFIPCLLIIIIVAIAIKLEDGGPILYRQKRITINDKDFEMLKFRSMIVDAEKATGAVLAEEDDPRITKTGRFLRKHRLDEIPQIINILKGDMSIVGPRPERRELKEKIEMDMPEFALRTRVKGGLTGYAQVYGKYNTSSYDKLKLDLIYIENYSLLLDLKLILMTPQILFRKESTEGIKK